PCGSAVLCNRKTHHLLPLPPFLPVLSISLYYSSCLSLPSCARLSLSLLQPFRFALASLCPFARRALFVCLDQRDSTPTTVDRHPPQTVAYARAGHTWFRVPSRSPAVALSLRPLAPLPTRLSRHSPCG